MAGIDRQEVLALLTRLGAALEKPTALCLIGSIPGIVEGQPERSTDDIDVWQPGSDFDVGDLRQACDRAGLMFDPKTLLEPGAAYLQLVRPGIVKLPRDAGLETIGRFGHLTVVMPSPAALCAAKLLRGSDSDIEDIVWWMFHRDLPTAAVETAVAAYDDPRDREAAGENLVLIRLALRSGAPR